MILADDLNQLLNILPTFISTPIKSHPNKEQLIEIVLDIGRRPEARFAKTTTYLSYRTIVWQDLDLILKKLGNFNGDNRAGIEKTLHRISSLRNRQGRIIGLTCRLGKAFFGTVSIIRDLLEMKKSILLLGKPGVGKTTIIREIARVLSDGMKKRVIIIDTSNEIAGDGDLPHPSIGKARRMQVPTPQNQHQIMIEAVENHMPEIIIIDEIGTELEAAAARTIAERGVQLVGTAHGNTLENLIKNPVITDLVGGIQYITLGDEEAKRRGSSKSILERKAPPTFEVAIEIHDAKTWIVHDNLEQSVDMLLQGQDLPLQKRYVTNNMIECELSVNKKDSLVLTDHYYKNFIPTKKQKIENTNTRALYGTVPKDKKTSSFVSSLKKKFKTNLIYTYVYGVNTQDLKSLIRTLKIPIVVTKDLQSADAILALSPLLKRNKKLRQICYSRKLTVHTIPSNSLLHITKVLRILVKEKTVSLPLPTNSFDNQQLDKIFKNELLTPLEEARLAIEEVIIPYKYIVDLIPQSKTIRKLQHELITHYHLKSLSVGQEPNRRLRIYPF